MKNTAKDRFINKEGNRKRCKKNGKVDLKVDIGIGKKCKIFEKQKFISFICVICTEIKGINASVSGYCLHQIIDI